MEANGKYDANTFEEYLVLNDCDEYFNKCIHEASHAVISEILRIPVNKVSIISKKEYGGYITHVNSYGIVLSKLYNQDYKTRLCINTDYALINLAGCAATAKLNQNILLFEYMFNGGNDDIQKLCFFNNYGLKLLFKDIDEIINNKYVWYSILKIAYKLKDKKILNGFEVRDIIKNTIPEIELKLLRYSYMFTNDRFHDRCNKTVKGLL
jgi:hypothetical protein